MATLLRKSSTVLGDLVQAPINDDKPIRIALLGGARSGKTSIISKLTLGSFRDTYYPTQQTQPILFHYLPQLPLARSILNENDMKHTLLFVSERPKLVLSPVIYQALSKITPDKPFDGQLDKGDVIVKSSNELYTTYHIPGDKDQIPKVSPILVELIDTVAFNPDQVVPFLEASLYVKLDKDILRKLADEPRRPVSTNPLLVASGASELNGSIDGYFFVYSAIPSYTPPSYADIEPTSSTSTTSSASSLSSQHLNLKCDTSFSLLSIMKQTLDEAWKEYYTYKTRWEQGKESDIFNFKTALKNFWKERTNAQVEAQRVETRANLTKLKLLDNLVDPADPSCPPPVWVICTHTKSPLASPKLIEDGERLAKFWKCGFVPLDVDDDTTDEALSLIIREILERLKLRAKRKRR